MQVLFSNVRFSHEDRNMEALKSSLIDLQRGTYPKSVQYIPKTKRPRKVHFVWADTNETKCEVVHNEHTLYSRWAPDVTCSICRQMMYNRGITQIL